MVKKRGDEETKDGDSDKSDGYSGLAVMGYYYSFLESQQSDVKLCRFRSLIWLGLPRGIRDGKSIHTIQIPERMTCKPNNQFNLQWEISLPRLKRYIYYSGQPLANIEVSGNQSRNRAHISEF